MGDLRDKYGFAIQTATRLRMQGSANERDGKLYFRGSVETQADIDKIWDAIQTIPDWRGDVVVDIKAAGATRQAHTVGSDDTLSRIPKEKLGDGNA